MPVRYTASLLTPIVAKAKSFHDVLRALGLSPYCGGNNTRIKKLISTYGINTSHFCGLRTNFGPNHKGGTKKLHWEKVLIFDRRGARKENVPRLRRAMIESGIPEVCSECGQLPKWNNKPLRLQIDHRDGNNIDNRPHNVRFLCPNCHTQTLNYGAKNIRHSSCKPVLVQIICEHCNKTTSKRRKLVARAKRQFCDIRCKNLFQEHKRMKNSKHQQIYREFLKTHKYLTTAKMFGVSDTLVRRIVSKYAHVAQ
jgi:hypothetical protein